MMAHTAGLTAFDTRGRILEAARDLFTEQGYESTSIREVADRVGITRSALYGHFAAKQEMLDALVAPLLDGIDAIAAAAARQCPVDREGALRAFVTLISSATATAGLFTPATQPGPTPRPDGEGPLDRLARALAGADDPRAILAVQCALGAARSGLGAALGWLSEDLHTGHGRAAAPTSGRPVLTGEQVDLVVQAALRAWSAVDPTDRSRTAMSRPPTPMPSRLP
jgi:AcrR family transcriptional regulator